MSDQQFLVYQPPIKAGPRHKILHVPHLLITPKRGVLSMCEKSTLRPCVFQLKDGHRVCRLCIRALMKLAPHHSLLQGS
jgi:hypothetical protein